jgi:hypothetical protein
MTEKPDLDRLDAELAQLGDRAPRHRGFVYGVLIAVERRRLFRAWRRLLWFGALALALVAVRVISGHAPWEPAAIEGDGLAVIALAVTALCLAAL